MKYFLTILFGTALSFFGEVKGLQNPCLPRIPSSENINPRVISAKMLGGVFFGGFRGIMVDLTWLYMDHLWHSARFYKLPPLYEFITTLQPEYIDGWVMGGWHMAYNMSHEVNDAPNLSLQLKKKIEMRWIFRGIDFLKTGTSFNPECAKLYFEIGWTYFHRLKDYKNSIYWFEKAVLQKDATDETHRLIARAYEKNNQPRLAHKKWLELKSHSSYNNPSIKKIIDDAISKIEKELGENE